MKLSSKYLNNIIWLFFDVFTKFFLTFLVSIWTAKYMGVANFGLYSYVLSIFSIFILIASLGMNGVVVKELVHDSNYAEILGSALFLQRIGAFFISIFLIIWAFLFNDSKPDNFILIFFLVLPTLFLQSSNIYKYWFEYKVLSKYTVIAQNLPLLIGSISKIFVIYFELDYIYILILTCIEQLLFVIFSWYFFNKNTFYMKFELKISRCFNLLSKSWPLIISGLAFIIYIRVDQIMIGEMLGMNEVGVFSVAVKFIEIFFFIPTILVSTFFPALVKLSMDSEDAYNDKMQLLYDITVIMGFFIFLFFIFFSDFVVFYSFGEEYIEAAYQLRIYSLVCIFYFLSTVSGRWYINAGLQKVAIFRNIIGLVIAVLLNFLLIPSMGLTGATISTVIAFVFSSYIFDLLDRRTRIVFYQKTKALFLFGAVSRVFREFYK